MKYTNKTRPGQAEFVYPSKVVEKSPFILPNGQNPFEKAGAVCYHNNRPRNTDVCGVRTVGNKKKFVMVDMAVLPDVFIKVVEAKKLLKSGKVKTVNDAVKAVDLSRSSYYKYHESISLLNEIPPGDIITFNAVLKDEPGVLSGLLNFLARYGANILTINQNIPLSGQASVTISARTGSLSTSIDRLIGNASKMNGIVRFEILGTEQTGMHR